MPPCTLLEIVNNWESNVFNYEGDGYFRGVERHEKASHLLFDVIVVEGAFLPQ